MITGKRKDGLSAEIEAGNHRIISGVAESLGGHDEGPSPHEILEAALAACTIITGQMWANHKGWKLDSIDVYVKILSEGEETRISREVSYRGDLTADQSKRLTEIIEKCPIHKLLESHVTIETKATSPDRT